MSDCDIIHWWNNGAQLVVLVQWVRCRHIVEETYDEWEALCLTCNCNSLQHDATNVNKPHGQNELLKELQDTKEFFF